MAFEYMLPNGKTILVTATSEVVISPNAIKGLTNSQIAMAVKEATSDSELLSLHCDENYYQGCKNLQEAKRVAWRNAPDHVRQTKIPIYLLDELMPKLPGSSYTVFMLVWMKADRLGEEKITLSAEELMEMAKTSDKRLIKNLVRKIGKFIPVNQVVKTEYEFDMSSMTFAALCPEDNL